MRRILSCIAVLFFSSSCFCAEWCLASQEFEYTQVRELNSSERALSSLLPELVMEQISAGLVRTPSTDELLERKRADLRSERLSLFLQLSAAVQERDSLVLSSSRLSESAYKKNLRDAEKKISGIEEKISSNIAKDTELVDSFSEGSIEGSVKEDISLSQNLFVPSEEALNAGVQSYLYEKELVAKKINGLITASIREYGGYIAVTANLYVYPGAVLAATVTEVGSTEDVLSLSKSLASSLIPYITNSIPVNLSFLVQPESAQSETVITIDEIVYPKGSMTHSVSAGTHTVELACPGFNTKRFTYSFTESSNYSIALSLTEEKEFDVALTLKKQISSVFYTEGVRSVMQPDGSVHLLLGDENTLGYMVVLDEEGKATDSTTFFYIPQNLLSDDAALVLNAKPSDADSLIDKRRIWTYRAYTALLMSLPTTFICMGNYNSALLAYQSGSLNSPDSVYAWNTARYISLGVTVTCGVFFIVELVRYLYTADSVIPSRVTKSPLETSKTNTGGI